MNTVHRARRPGLATQRRQSQPGLALAGPCVASAAARPWPPAEISPHVAGADTWFTDADVSRYPDGLEVGVLVDLRGHEVDVGTHMALSCQQA